MKFVKQNMVVLICATVALLLVVGAFVWPVPGWIATIKTDNMQARLGMRSVIKQLTTTSLVLPGQPERKGIPSKDYIQAKKDSIKAIDVAKDKVVEASKKFNLEGRVVFKGNTVIPVLPVPGAGAGGRGIEEEGFLPKITSDPAKYKADYRSQFALWTGMLSQGTVKPVDADDAMPPDPAALKATLDEQLKGRPSSGGGLGFVPAVSAESAEALNAQKQAVMNKAASMRMYVERSAFQQCAWSLTDSSPDDVQIFESLVDSWLQSDVVKAIVATNLQTNPNPGDSKHIGISAVKRLTRIMIGINARNHLVGGPGAVSAVLGSAGGALGSASDAGGPLFLLPTNGIGATGGGVQQMPVGGGSAVATSDYVLPDNEIHYEVGMSGRAAGKTYDIVNLAIQVDIDPARLNAFINELYRQNPGYSVSGIQIKAVDPLDRASNGYLYGDGQVVEAEIQVECLLFRSWTRPIMPDGESGLLMIPPYKAPTAAGAPAAPAAD